MKIKVIAITFLFIIMGGLIAFAKIKQEIIGETKSYKEAKQMWGEQDFDSDLFKKGDTLLRAKMSVSLLKQNRLKGQRLSDMRNILGEHTGYFQNDQIPVYIITEDWKNGKDTWQLVLLPDSSNNVGEAVINKNCCQKK